MEPSLVTLGPHFSGTADDFPALLRRKGLLAPATVTSTSPVATPHQKSWQPTEATTILAFKFSGGVLRGWQGARAFQAVAGQHRLRHARSGSSSADFRDVQFSSETGGATLFLRRYGRAV